MRMLTLKKDHFDKAMAAGYLEKSEDGQSARLTKTGVAMLTDYSTSLLSETETMASQ